MKVLPPTTLKLHMLLHLDEFYTLHHFWVTRSKFKVTPKKSDRLSFIQNCTRSRALAPVMRCSCFLSFDHIVWTHVTKVRHGLDVAMLNFMTKFHPDMVKMLTLEWSRGKLCQPKTLDDED
ncbi:hypothetical protein DPMN_071393 [Dreissena polymorpha]|uniref:Uncharacterized protein n=1 Tax=Dreissena polymorpha TaxID=45954 RepID=A0A9D4BPL6_DREPO|nr:hypothetical protein DPMN_071393 [Dreissena polymorpha]